MPVLRELPIIDAPSQRFATVLMGRSCTFAVHYSEWSDRWSFDLEVDGQPVLQGRRIVTGVDLLGAFDLDLGVLAAVPMRAGAQPDRAGLPGGAVRLYHVEPDATDEGV